MTANDRVLPSFVVKELERYLDCGILERGFCRLRCSACGFDRLVGFSCKGSWCPSCGGRRMAESAAFLVDNVFPNVPVRQWVLSLPKPVRYLLAYDTKLATKVINIFINEVFRWFRRTAKRRLNLRSVKDAQPAGVVVIQRFDSAVQLNWHLHALLVDGVFLKKSAEPASFEALPAPTNGDILQVAWNTCQHTMSMFLF